MQLGVSLVVIKGWSQLALLGNWMNQELKEDRGRREEVPRRSFINRFYEFEFGRVQSRVQEKWRGGWESCSYCCSPLFPPLVTGRVDCGVCGLRVAGYGLGVASARWDCMRSGVRRGERGVDNSRSDLQKLADSIPVRRDSTPSIPSQLRRGGWITDVRKGTLVLSLPSDRIVLSR